MTRSSLVSPLNQDSILDKKAENSHKIKLKKDKIYILFCGFSCCNNELGDLFSTEYDIEKYGFYLTNNPESADILVFSGVHRNEHQKNFLESVYKAMRNPKHLISVGSCANGDGIYFNEIGGMFENKEYKIKADMYIPGCPPTAEAVLYGMLKLKEQYYL